MSAIDPAVRECGNRDAGRPCRRAAGHGGSHEHITDSGHGITMWPQRAAEGTGRDDTGEVARLRALCSEAARHLRTLPEQSPLKDVRMAERLEAAAGENTGEEREFVLGLRDLLNEMQLHDDTGDRHDAGYMSAVNEVREWLKRNAAASTQEGTRA